MIRRAGFVALAALLGFAGLASAAPAPVATIELEGVISPVTLRLIGIAIDRAQAERAQALVVLLDTPGGLERSMRAIVQRMMNAEVPVIVFVSPTGARAASAGVFITMAAHVAAMSPATNIGAATPVAMGGTADKTMMKKVENDSAAFIRTVALERGRNAEWAEKAVRQAVAITEREALKLKVIDLVADSLPDLLDKVDGRTIKLPKSTVTLATKGAPLRPIEIGFRVSWWVIGPTVAGTAGLFLFVIAAGVRALGRPPATGAEGLVGKLATVRERLAPEGQVLVAGEIWRAVVDGEPLEPGVQVRIVTVDGLTLRVAKTEAEAAKAQAKGGVA